MSLPTFEPRRTDEPLMLYAARVLIFLIRTECTASCSDEDLELAKHAAVYAAGNTALKDAAADRINNTAALCTLILRARKQEREAEQSTQPAAQPSKPNIGPMAPLQPQPIVRPPSPAAVKPEFSF